MKKKTLHLFICLLILSIPIYSQANNALINHQFAMDPDTDAVFLINSLVISSYTTEKKYTINIEYESINGLNFIHVKNKVVLPNNQSLNIGKYLILHNDSITIFYENDKVSPTLICSQGKMSWYPSDEYDFITSSNLIENKIKYDSTHFNKFSIGAPWVPDLQNDVKPIITMKIKNKQTFGNVYLLVLNGFVSYNKPWLFEQNRRIKKIQVNSGNNTIKIIELEDTPEPQVFNVDMPNNDIKIEILDYYKGSKYNDICITSIVPALF